MTFNGIYRLEIMLERIKVEILKDGLLNLSMEKLEFILGLRMMLDGVHVEISTISVVCLKEVVAVLHVSLLNHFQACKW